MRAYKGFNSELTSVMGDGKKENCVFKLGETKRVESSKTVRSGFHCCENPFECLGYYPVDGKNRYFEVEAAGSIDEDGSERIACTEITLIRELDIAELALAGMAYMIMHPHRSGWQQSHRGAEVHKDKSKTNALDTIAIARGANPMVKGPEGAILGVIVELNGMIITAKCWVQTADKASKWCTINRDREVIICEEEAD